MKNTNTIFLTLVLATAFFAVPHASFATGRVSASVISNNTTEAGSTATFTITLDEPIICADPEAECNVTIPISSSDTSEGVLLESEVVFADDAWHETRTVTVTGVADDIDDGDVAYTIVLGAVTSESEYYNGFNPTDVTVTNTDDDTAAILTETTVDDTSESVHAGEVEVVLDSEPTANVTIGVYSGDATEGTVSPEELTFTPENWNEPQLIEVIGVDDFIDDGLVAYDILFEPAVSEDENYNGLVGAPAGMYTADDDDTAGIALAQTGTTVLEGSEATDEYQLSFVLESEPTAAVTITLDSDEQIQFDVNQLTFEPEEWNTPQYVYVTAVNDAVVEDETVSTINFTVTSDDVLYDEFVIEAASVSVTNNDPEVVLNGRYIQVVLNGVVIDQKKVAKNRGNAELYKLKTKKLYPRKAYTTVAYVRVRKESAKLVVFRLTKNNTLTKRAVAIVPIQSQEEPRLKLKRKRHRIVVRIGEGDQAEVYRWKLGKRGALHEVMPVE